MLGLVKHVTFVEKVWFDEAITGWSRKEMGVASTPDKSFILNDDDTIASIASAYRDACDKSRRAVDSMNIDDVVDGRGPSPPLDDLCTHAS